MTRTISRLLLLVSCSLVTVFYLSPSSAQDATADSGAKSNVEGGDAIAIERWDRAICLMTEHKSSDGNAAECSAFLLEHEKEFYLVSAAHSAQDTHSRTKVVFRNAKGESRWIDLGGLVESASNPWYMHPSADLAVVHLQEQPALTAIRKELDALAISTKCLSKSTPVRTTAIDIVGFPLALGVQPVVSSTVVRGTISSRDMQFDAKWGKETLFLAAPTVASGTSGGPIFEALPNSTDVRVVGMYVGLLFDSTGGKITKAIPAHLLLETIEKLAADKKADQDTSKTE